MDRTVAYYTLGCKLNFAETSTIARDLSRQGFVKTAFEEPADLYVINTCSVTDNADKRCRGIVRQALRTNPEAFIAVVGCYAQLKPEEIASIPGVDLVLGASEKFELSRYLDDLSKNDMGEVHSCEIGEADFYVGSYAIGDRTRAFLKVQDGCDYKCTYCTIPLARGISRSDTLENVLANAREISEKGIREIVLTGVNIGDYGKGEFGDKRHKHTFLDLVRALDEVPGIERVRISSIEPNLLRNETIDFVSGSRHFVPHFHIPLQSGSNDILKQMRRRYLRELYADRVGRIREVMPHACIGADVIVGFPGETEAHFMETYRFLHELDISYLHVFTYSERDDTAAAAMEGAVPVAERRRRSKMLRSLSAKKRRAFYRGQLGTVRTVLFESENKRGYIHGFTENYVKVKAPWDPSLAGTLQRIRLTAIDPDGLVRIEPVSEEIQA
ncbi:tRNA (N(6)-L-threonylcarbamoyladenosine(37)-C(2))-methylthiotransferase MtaB [Robiginitalea sp. SC105]|uniref:tRNA (N(6)-L-threonylcarbamoyladenosine(37)-C(2))- methylthiotransferase MtaB n=1 Tax=Robiginitalea sp. SC105 TaxID=2762332 RepID=UPI00163A6FB1|nr:tRNA (N(6)-L-threonylcarbamoyladenosine(37)-C(2))-methylthiotransferase MtaB [Robiginitalea sp. SC105]MBC2839437.1 tRNA (N(6)-L-threonylcarbamoyladenosine(37)-C(2))-methylthiotransferase MtaB [Robiginitalea sp. SC105]